MKTQKVINKLVLLGLIVYTLAPLSVRSATTLTDRSVTLGTSAAAADTTYTISFEPSANENIGSIKFQLCDSPLELGACNQPASASFLTPGASFVSGAPTSAAFSGFNLGSGAQATTDTTLWITGTPVAVTSGTGYTVRLNSVHNPTTTNMEFYVRITTYSDSAGSSQNEYGAVAVSTASQITITGTMPESLVFCVAESISGDCTSTSGDGIVDFGTFSPLSTRTGTSMMMASTNASSGYSITIHGTTMTSGSNTITAMGTQSQDVSTCTPSCTSSIGTSQFGTNVRANSLASATPNSFGADVTGAGSGAGYGGYNLPNTFRFFSGDRVASAGAPTRSNIFTNSYIVNVGGDQAAGQYTATMTYICTATF